MTQTGTLFSRTIKLFTKSPYNHISIGFDDHLQEIYSFGRKKPRNPLLGGFVNEGINKGVYEVYKNTKCRIYKIEINEEEYIRLEKKIELFKRRRNRYKYNLMGVIAVMFGIPVKRKYHYFCTQFVARLLHSSKIFIFNKDISLVMPEDFYYIEKAVLVYEGKLAEYMPA